MRWILVVDNDQQLSVLLKKKIENADFYVKLIHSQDEGVQWLEDHTPALLILSHTTSGINGKEFVDELKKRGITIPPFIVSSDQNDVTIAVEMMKLGARDYIIKGAGYPDKIQSTINDIGYEPGNEEKYKEADEKTYKANLFNEQIIENANVGIVILDCDLKYRIWNPFMEKLTGYSSTHIIGKEPFQMFPFLADLGIKDFYRRILLGERILPFDYEFDIPKTGKSGWVYESGSPLFSNDGEITGIIITILDISEHKLLEESLVISKRRLRQVIDLVPHYIYAKENNGNFILANKAVADFYGISVKKIKGLTDSIFGSTQEIRKCNLTDGKVIKEEIIIQPDGAKRVLETTNIQYKTVDDRVPAELCVSIDITQRRENEKLISKLSKAVEQSANSIIITDINGNIEYTNQRFTEITGYSREEINGEHIKILYRKEQVKQEYTDIWNKVRSGEIWKGEFYTTNKNGSCIWEQMTISPIENESGTMTNLLIIGEDITALKENEQRLKTIINNIPDVIVFKDRNKRWIEVNKATLHLFDLNENNYFGKTASELAYDSEFYSEIIKSTELSDEVAFSNKQPFTFEKQIPHPSGNSKIYEFKKVPIYDEDSLRKGLVVIGRDITERKHKEKELIKAKEKAEQSDRLKTAFLQNISHEIRTPMNAIIGFSKVLEQPDITAEKQKKFASIIATNTNHLLSIVTNILTTASLETKQEIVFERKTNINSLIYNLLSTYKFQAEEQDITLIAKKTLTDKQSEIYTDKIKLNQILTNLINNAFKFTNEGGIEFGYELKSLVAEQNKWYLVFYVKDTGIGIEENNLNKIFDRFVQLDLLESRKYGGNGIGLTIAKGFVELLGGKIWAESEKGKGSTFYFSIPYKPANKGSNEQLIETTSIWRTGINIA